MTRPFQYDSNQNGYLEKQDLKRMVQENSAPDLPKGVVKAAMNFRDSELNGQIDFDDFYQFSQDQTSTVRDWYIKYCKHLVPHRSNSINDAIDRSSIETNFDTAGMSRNYRSMLHLILVRTFQIVSTRVKDNSGHRL